MMFRADLALIVALSAMGVAAEPKAASNKPTNCIKAHGDIIRGNFEHPKVFCEWYNSGKRGASPVNGLTADQFTHSCACILGQKASTGNVAAVRNPGWSKQCVNTAKDLLDSEVKQPAALCNFWESADWRGTNPFPSMNNGPGQLYNACQCLKTSKHNAQKPKAKTTTPAKPSHTSTATGKGKTSAAATKTAASSSPTKTNATKTGTTSAATKSAAQTSSSATTSSTTSLDASAAATATSLGFAKRYNQARHAAYRG